ncbi:hypothetical protein F2P56_015706 [Juglans regia]|uniref:Uncharacterized protein LOC109007277 isoform X1 n=2 Tax=Juglans regia TaxID=51240 RepID=A0A2I4GEW7_JUGRE|nr:uncharacterized protein LOC109007277 isoform X1 [Juglans regia]KAF5465725.1 hypothetical protein F2P56_015706 [Juglans regia]
MGEILYDLEQALRSKKEKIRPEEENFFRACKSDASRFFRFNALAAGCLTFSATGRLNLLSQISLSGGAAALFGLWRFGRHLDSCVDRVLAHTGDRMQFELANIILTKYRHDPWRMQLISKHFFPEEVFDDTNPDQPKLLWRYRTLFNDVIRGQSAHESDSPSYSKSDSNSNNHGDSHKNHTNSYNRMHSDPRNDSDGKRTNSESKEVPGNPGIDLMDNPFDCVFGNLALREEVRLPNTSSIPPGTHTRGHKRSNRRRRMRHQDVPINPQHMG